MNLRPMNHVRICTYLYANVFLNEGKLFASVRLIGTIVSPSVLFFTVLHGQFIEILRFLDTVHKQDFEFEFESQRASHRAFLLCLPASGGTT